MSDELTAIDLFRIHDDKYTLDCLHSLQHDRLLDKDITGGDRPAGMRLSIPDPVRRVKAVFDPFWALRIDEGVGARGHLLEDYLQVALFEDDTLDGRYYNTLYEAQVPIKWHEHGVSAFDFVVRDERVVSCKTSIGSARPTSANIAQERRMMALAGFPAGSVFEIWTIDPSAFRAIGPFEYTLDADHITTAQRELAGVSAAFDYFYHSQDPVKTREWNDPDAWLKKWKLESTSRAFKYDTLDASGAVEARVRAERRAAAAKREAEAAHKAASDLLFTFVDEQLALSPDAVGVTAYSGDEEVVYARKSNGAKQVTVKPRTAESAA